MLGTGPLCVCADLRVHPQVVYRTRPREDRLVMRVLHPVSKTNLDFSTQPQIRGYLVVWKGHQLFYMPRGLGTEGQKLWKSVCDESWN